MFYSGKRVLVTGGTGFVGTHIVQELLKQGASVRIPIHRRQPVLHAPEIETIPADLTRPEDCLAAVRDIDYVFHAGGAVASAAVSPAGAMEAITTNLVLTARMLQAAWEAEVGRFLIYSSSTGYPPADHPIREDEMWSGPPPAVYFGYGWMRRYFEILGEFVSSKSGVGVAIVRPTAIYGRWDNFDPRSGHVIPALIRRAVERENPFVVWGRGDEVRDFLHVSDLARGSLLALEKLASCDPVNIGYGRAMTIKEVVGVILEATGFRDAEVVFDASRPTTIPVRVVDTGKARKLLGFEPRVPFAEGIGDTVSWYMDTRATKSGNPLSGR